jgi:acyl-CoA synthetase (AMP-forming)/AMP-acid ligase II
VIAHELLNLAQRDPQALALTCAQRSWSYSQLIAAAGSIAKSIEGLSVDRVGVWFEATPTLIATLIALDSLGIETILFSNATSPDSIGKFAANLKIGAVLTDKPPLPASQTYARVDFKKIDLSGPAGEPLLLPPDRSVQVILFTSGTSGRPKPAIHNWRTLSAGVNRNRTYALRRWLLAYDPTSFAGIQVWLQALLTGGTLSIPDSRDPAAAAARLVNDRVEIASATPSFWRLLMLSSPAEELIQVPLVQITLGGEPVDQLVLDTLRTTFPKARITHIYASTEMGVCFAVNDAQAGFPASYLEDPKLPTELRISPLGELEIRSRRAMLRYLDDSLSSEILGAPTANSSSNWFATGDLVQRRGERILFIGRKSETINVGGMKVYPSDVEQCIRLVPEVRDVRVFPVSSSITGQLVSAEIQPAPGANRVTLQAQILQICRQRLARHQVPTSIRFRDTLPLTESGKRARREALDGV